MSLPLQTGAKDFLNFIRAYNSHLSREEESIANNIEAITNGSASPRQSLNTSSDRTKQQIELSLSFRKLLEGAFRRVSSANLQTPNPNLLDKQDSNHAGWTMLHYAAALGFSEVVEMLLMRGANANITDAAGNTPLAIAEKSSQEKIAARLTEFTSESANGSSNQLQRVQFINEIERIREIIELKDLLSLETAIENSSIVMQDERSKTTLLHVAAYLGNTDAVDLLISHGAKPDTRDQDSLTTLHKAVIGGHLVLTRGATINVADNQGRTALHHAADTNTDIVKLLIEKGANINPLDAEKCTPLHHAVTAAQPEIVELLVRSGADCTLSDAKGVTPLHLAALENQLKEADDTGANVNTQDLAGLSPLHNSAFLGHIEFTKMLLDQKTVHLNLLDKTHNTPLHKACFKGHTDCAKLLLDRGAEVEFPEGTTTPLHHAAFGGHVPCLQLLLQRGAVVNARDNEGATSLHKAAFNGHMDVVKLLLENGADVLYQDNEGSTALHKAAWAGQAKIIELLLRHGAEIDAQDNEDGTPLHNAAFNGHLDCVKTLLQSQANLNGADSKGASPLHLAVLNGHASVAQFLVGQGAPVDSPDDRGMIALHHAIAHVACLQFLIEKGSAVDAKDHLGRTPLYYASKNGCEEPCRFLISKGADVNCQDNNGKSPFDVATPSFQNIFSKALKEREQQLDSETAKKFQTAAKLFNQKPKKGIEFLLTNNIINDTPDEIATFLMKTDGLNKNMIGELIGEGDAKGISILTAYVNQMDFTGLDFDDALRYFLSKFMLPGEAQKIDRIMERFAGRFVQTNPHIFPHQDTAYILAFSLIMLNTDAHNPQIKNKMTKEQFLRNNRGINGTNPEYLSELYDKIVKNEIKLQGEASMFTSAEKKGWCMKQGGRIKTWKKRWLVLKDNCLYYFKQADSKEQQQPCGIIPLENLLVRTCDVKGKKNAFEVYSGKYIAHCVSHQIENGEIKSCKLSNGQLVKGHHGSYLICVDTADEMDAWIAAIRNNISFNPLFEMIKKRMKYQESGSEDMSATKVDMQDLHDACFMTGMAYKSSPAIKEVYGNLALIIEETESIRFFLLSYERTKTQVIVLSGTMPETQLQNVTDVYKQLQVEKAADHIDKTLIKYLKKDFQTFIYGHGLGGGFAILLALHLQNENFKVNKIYSFGAPKIIKNKEAMQYRTLPVTRVVDFHDLIPGYFKGYSHVGPAVVLFSEVYYSVTSQDYLEVADSSRSAEMNHVESYIRNLKLKLKKATAIPFEERETLNLK